MGMTREALWGELNNSTVFEGALLEAYEFDEKKRWKEEIQNPHGRSWHLSMHGSQFPGEDDLVCGRAQVYGLLDPYEEKPREPRVRMLFDQGLDIEHRFVERLSRHGILLSADVTGDDDFQTSFEDSNIWLTGSPDAIILPRFTKKAHVVEIKTTSMEKVENMKSDPGNVPMSHTKYMRQLKLYICRAHDMPFTPSAMVCRISGTIMNKKFKCNHKHDGECDGVLISVEPPDSGTLIYAPREEPLNTVSYYAKYDPTFYKSGSEKLAKWKQYFLEDKIPPHVLEGQSAKWSVDPCKWCDLKKSICKIDYKEKVTSLSKSNLIKHNQTIRPDYDFEKTRKAVLEFWEGK
jgi:hypothetical protein